VGACQTREAAEAIVREKTDRFVTEATTSVSVIQDVTVEPVSAGDDIIKDEKEISRLLDPDNESSDFALKVIVTEDRREPRLVPYESEYTYSARLLRGR
jgi:hypothetical protein